MSPRALHTEPIVLNHTTLEQLSATASSLQGAQAEGGAFLAALGSQGCGWGPECPQISPTSCVSGWELLEVLDGVRTCMESFQVLAKEERPGHTESNLDCQWDNSYL